MGGDKNPFSAIVTRLGRSTRNRELLEALADLLGPADGQVFVEVELDALIDNASTRAALRDPTRPLDQAGTRKTAWALFKDFEAAHLGKATPGRRGGHRSRFRFFGGNKAGGGPGAHKKILTDLLNRQAPSRTPDHIDRVIDDFGLPVWQRRQASSRMADEEIGGKDIAAPASLDRLRRDDVVARIEARSDDIRAFGVKSLSLFGSVARDEARPDSDVDLVAAFESDVTSDGFFGTKFFLEDLLGKRVDLVTESALREPIRRVIESERIRVA